MKKTKLIMPTITQIVNLPQKDNPIFNENTQTIKEIPIDNENYFDYKFLIDSSLMGTLLDIYIDYEFYYHEITEEFDNNKKLEYDKSIKNIIFNKQQLKPETYLLFASQITKQRCGMNVENLIEKKKLIYDDWILLKSSGVFLFIENFVKSCKNKKDIVNKLFTMINIIIQRTITDKKEIDTFYRSMPTKKLKQLQKEIIKIKMTK